MTERLTDEQLKARGLVLAEMVQQEATIAALRARVAKLETALTEAQFALLYGDKEEFSEALDAIDAALKDKP